MIVINATKSSIKILAFSLLLSMMPSIGCKKFKAPPPEIPKEEIIKPETGEPKEKLFLPVKFESPALTLEIEYTAHTGFINILKFSNGQQYEITYVDALLKKLRQFNSGKEIYFADYLAASGKITRVSPFEINGQRDDSKGKYLLTYDAGGQLSTSKWYNVANSLVEEKEFYYGPTGLLTTSTAKKINTVNASYTYDTKKGIFSNVKSFQLLSMEVRYAFLNYGACNLTKYTEATDEKATLGYTYIYNTDNYPGEITIKTASATQTFKISYIELK
ncbi:MAG: hypothetical protein V4687_07535 [Bacteroidota bacterium]